MLWLLVTVFAYLLLAVSALGDKVLLAGPIRKPATYAAWVGFAGLFVLLAAPFLGFPIPPLLPLLSAFGAGAVFTCALLPYYRGIQLHEISRIVPATGGLVPIFTFFLGFLLLPGGAEIDPATVVAFAVLVVGSVLLSLNPEKLMSGHSLWYALAASSLFATSFFLLKYAYLLQPFWSGFLWMQIGGGVAAAVLLARRETREDVRRSIALTRETTGKRMAALFVVAQASGAVGGITQRIAFFLAPAAYFAFVNALQGTQYLFILVFSALLSMRYPDIFREANRGMALVGKIIGVTLVIIGTAFLVLLNPDS